MGDTGSFKGSDLWVNKILPGKLRPLSNLHGINIQINIRNKSRKCYLQQPHTIDLLKGGEEGENNDKKH